MTALPIPAAAADLGITPRALRRMIDNKAPVARSGRRGRGKSTLVDPDTQSAHGSIAAHGTPVVMPIYGYS